MYATRLAEPSDTECRRPLKGAALASAHPSELGFFLFREQIREAAPFDEPRILVYVRRGEEGRDKVDAPE